MPEVKWVHKLFLHKPETKVEDGLVLLPIPVLTLDQIEEWLKENEYWRTAHGLHVCLDDLLAQVQEWKQAGGSK